MLKGLEMMIDVQKQVREMMKIAEEVNTMITEIKGTILKASINNRIMNTTNILGILEDLQNLIQCNMVNRTYQIQRMLANELDTYKGKDNKYVEDNIKEIQGLYKIEEDKRNQGVIEKDKVILIKSYKVSLLSSTTTTKSSFIDDEIKNLMKYIKFV